MQTREEQRDALEGQWKALKQIAKRKLVEVYAEVAKINIEAEKLYAEWKNLDKEIKKDI